MNKRVMLQLTATIPLLMASAACGPKPAPQLITPPAELAVCADEPPAPDLPSVDWSTVDTARPVVRSRDIAVFDYILALRSAWGNCRSKVDGLAVWREEATD